MNHKAVSIVRDNRKIFDKMILRVFRGVFLRWCDKHLAVAYETLTINSEQLHNIDAQMKADLGLPGYDMCLPKVDITSP